MCVCVYGPVKTKVYMEMQRVKNSKSNLKNNIGGLGYQIKDRD